jgi:ribosomal protein L21E
MWPFDVAMARTAGVGHPGIDLETGTGSEDPSLRLQQMQACRVQAWQSLRDLTCQLGERHEQRIIPTHYHVGQLILIKINPFEREQLPSRKFQDHWTGPHRVIEVRENKVTYKVRSLLDLKERVVHIGRTKPYLRISEEDLIKVGKSLPQLAKVVGPRPL